jgi:hypothetical protein
LSPARQILHPESKATLCLSTNTVAKSAARALKSCAESRTPIVTWSVRTANLMKWSGCCRHSPPVHVRLPLQAGLPERTSGDRSVVPQFQLASVHDAVLLPRRGRLGGGRRRDRAAGDAGRGVAMAPPFPPQRWPGSAARRRRCSANRIRGQALQFGAARRRRNAAGAMLPTTIHGQNRRLGRSRRRAARRRGSGDLSEPPRWPCAAASSVGGRWNVWTRSRRLPRGSYWG